MVTEVSGSGKATMILESLLSALNGMTQGEKFPEYVIAIGAEKFEKVKLIDVVPVGINVRSAVAIYAGVHDELRKIFRDNWKPGNSDTRQKIFPTTQENFCFSSVTEPDASVWRCRHF